MTTNTAKTIPSAAAGDAYAAPGAVDYDALIVGAGFAGLRSLYELRDRLGLSVKVLEKGSDVGGTWYWNRYPGARTDIESWAYCLFFDEGLYEDWEWQDCFPAQARVLDYLSHVADRFDLRRDIEFGVRVDSATWDETHSLWRVATDDGRTITARYFISAAGLMSVPLEPDFPGVESFTGESYLSGRWPKHDVSYEGKRVAIIGTGASAVQMTPIVARTAAQLTIFQRTPNYVLPGRNGPLDKEVRKELRQSRDETQRITSSELWGMPIVDTKRCYDDFKDDAERRLVLEREWEAGGLGFLFRCFADLLVKPEAARLTQQFLHEKIRNIVHDPDTAELLCPKTYHPGAKRPPLGNRYYESFNRDNVRLVDISDNPIHRITETGLQLADGDEHDFDMIIFALGFDSMVGPMVSMNIRGRDGQSIAERWAEGAESFLGFAVDGFPNMFMLTGPQIPGGNIPPTIEVTTGLIAEAITHMREHGHGVAEMERAVVQEYVQHCEQLVEASPILWQEGQTARSWMIGANVDGRKPKVLFHFGGVPMYGQEAREFRDSGLKGLNFSSAGSQRSDTASPALPG